MNQPFKPEAIIPILADVGVSISDLKKNPAAVISEARKRQVAILNRNRPVAYVISPEVWEHINDLFEDIRDGDLVEKRLANMGEAIPVTLDDLRD
ncbi:MAG: hypothetical protein RLZZ58_627 [Pseudomonadota bacterium]